MQLRLTKLVTAVLLSSCLASNLCLASESGVSLSSSEQSQYLLKIKRLYLTDNDRQALLAHCNDLLKTYALRAGYQVTQSNRQDLLYQLSLGTSGELLLREESRAQQGGALAVRNRPLNLYGVDPFVRYECPSNGISCVLHNPADGSPLLTIVRDHQGAAELAKALSFLIRNVQKG
ncbi:hypothetical protein [Pseudomonas sp. 5P_3.1_Bac2]|uniref:hypothetical protein n=1 Tax=Pseudomonas sp. 5P_3.1_Bac2 TaxID=2971617 RepID=UPI0021C7525B|nr:hypothetical protein [Pseudomonas sp. 5P_3.1_Bac2]MCU1718353.1 hypothetical protein [Pseudomonas sp. 5P_3.1_Bac2]